MYQRRFFSRSIEPSPVLTRLLNATLCNSEVPLNFFYLWGMYKRCQKNEYDQTAIALLADMLNHISNVLSRPIVFTLILADVHARLNGMDEKAIKEYGRDIMDEALVQGWRTEWLSYVWQNTGLEIDEVYRIADSMSDEMVDDLLFKSAAKYYTGDDKLRGAKCYLAMRLIEKKAIEQKFKDAIHLTAADPRLSYLQPELPTFHIWTLKRGTSRKPWFLE